MKNDVKRDARKTWARPTLQRMEAGSAENTNAGAIVDGNPAGNKTS